MIEVKNLTRKYGSFTAVNSISFEIPKGQIIGLLGHNGAGKTTTLQVLTGYLEPTEGKVTIGGLDIEENCREIQEKIGYLSEQSPLYPEMPVWQYLSYVANLRGIPETQQAKAIQDAIIATDLGSKAGDCITTLSKGFCQRVGVAQAIIHKPEILVLDEPTNGLDPTQILAMRQLIKNLSQSSTVIVSTHILQEVEAICDRAIIILNGSIAIDSKLSDLQANKNLTLSLKEPLDTVKSLIDGVDGVKSISPLSQEGDLFHYSIESNETHGILAPTIARKVHEKGWDLHGIKTERRNLETVFKEVNSKLEGVSHVQ